jgi:RHS repeat-associated protein
MEAMMDCPEGPDLSHEATYDSLGRLTNLERTNWAQLPARSGVDPLTDELAWTLSGANEWASVATTTNGNTATQTRTHGDLHELQSTASPTASFTYDAQGNRLTDGANTYTYDAYHRLRLVTDKATGAVKAQYDYDALDRRTTKHAGGLETRFVYDGPQVVEERGGTGILLRQFVHGGAIDHPVVMDVNLNSDATATGAGDKRYSYHQDTLGNVIGLTNSAGKLVEGYLYEPYGKTFVVRAGPDGNVTWNGDDVVATTSALGNPYAFTGQRLDPETGLYYYRARYYDPAHGVFLSRDPLGVWGDQGNFGNPYSYVGNNPLNFRDPSGACPICVTAGIGAGLGAIVGGIGYAVFHEGEWDWGQFGASVSVGALAGGLIGTGVGAMHGLGIAGSAATAFGAGSMGLASAGLAGTGGGAFLAGSMGLASAGLAGTGGGAFLAGAGGAVLWIETHDLMDDGRLNYGWRNYARDAIWAGIIAAGAEIAVGGIFATYADDGAAGLYGSLLGGEQVPATLRPARVARVYPDSGTTRATLGRPGEENVFVVAADDIAGLNAQQLAERLGIPPSRTGSFRVVEFDTPADLRHPTAQTPGVNAQFREGGHTIGGAREFVTRPIPPGAAVRVVN